jgi:uncharacterized membrane protein YbhN (UPF0104 family)
MNLNVADNNDIFSAQIERKKILRWLLYFVLFVVVFIFFTHYFSSIENDFLLLKKVRPLWLLVAILSQLLTYVVLAFIYRFLLLALSEGSAPSLPALIRATLIAQFLINLYPVQTLAAIYTSFIF